MRNRTISATKILALSAFVCLIILPVIVLSNLYFYFHWSFNRYSVYENFSNYSTIELNIKFNQVLQYINLPFNTELDSNFFSKEDRLHMQDVRNLFIIANGIFIVSLLITGILLVMKTPDRSAKAVLIRNTNRLLLVFICILLIIGIYLIFTWKSGFVLFHQLLFPNNSYWMLNPVSSNLIKYLPEQIFQELALLYLAGMCIEYLFLRQVINILETRSIKSHN